MSEIIYPVRRLLANPKVFYAIAAEFEGPDAELIKDIFYDLVEAEMEDEEPAECEFHAGEVCFRFSPDEPGVIQVILDTGSAAELRPNGEYISNIKSDSDLFTASMIYQRLVQAIEEAAPHHKGDIALCEPPLPSNSYLRSDDGECFEGSYHLMSDPDRQFRFNVEIIDLDADILSAKVFPVL